MLTCRLADAVRSPPAFNLETYGIHVLYASSAIAGAVSGNCRRMACAIINGRTLLSVPWMRALPIYFSQTMRRLDHQSFVAKAAGRKAAITVANEQMTALRNRSPNSGLSESSNKADIEARSRIRLHCRSGKADRQYLYGHVIIFDNGLEYPIHLLHSRQVR